MENNCPNDQKIEDIKGRLDQLECTLTDMIKNIENITSVKYIYSDASIKKAVEQEIHRKIALYLNKATWHKVDDKFVVYCNEIINEKTGLPRSAYGITVYEAMINFTNILLFDEFGIPNENNL